MAAYQTPKALSVLEQSDKGLYGLVAANGMGEAFTGKDMFGHPVSAEEQRQSFVQAMTAMVGLKGMGRPVEQVSPLAEKGQTKAEKVDSGGGIKDNVGEEVSEAKYTGDLMDPVEASRYDEYWNKAGIGSTKTYEDFIKNNPHSNIDPELFTKFLKGAQMVDLIAFFVQAPCMKKVQEKRIQIW